MARTDMEGTIELVPWASRIQSRLITAAEFRKRLNLGTNYYYQLVNKGRIPVTRYRVGPNICHDWQEFLLWNKAGRPERDVWSYPVPAALEALKWSQRRKKA